MESPRKFNDCYFYYYSTCTKGDNCVFRHEPSALGCETMCTAWQQGKCLDKRCKLRHMELRKNRKQIPCYWENQPGGCRKKHCPFMHKNPDARTDGIAPSQPAPAMPAAAAEAVGAEAALPLAAPPAPAPAVPLLWQQQRQVVVDSAILGVLPASSELLGGRRVLAPHPHDAPPNPYAPLHPVDPLVVNFEEESDNESCPPPTPTKARSPSQARSKSQELVLLERIQAEAAAYYGYDAASLPAPRPPAIARPAPARTDLDFKVLSLDEIRARKKAEALAHAKPITLNLSRKRKLSTQEINTTSGKKIIKVVRSNSIVYKKLDPNAPPAAAKPEQKPEQPGTGRKRTLSEQCVDIYDMQDDELVDNVYEFKRIKVAEQTNSKPKLIRNRLSSKTDADKEADSQTKIDNDSDTEVQIVSVDIQGTTLELSDSEVIDVDSANVSEPVDIVDLSDEAGDSDADLEYVKNVPDVVASCQKKSDNTDKDLLKDIDAILDDDDDL